MNDSVRRSLRTLFQVTLGAIGSGALTVIWNSFMSNHKVDPTIEIAMGIVLAGLVSWAHNALEDSGAIPAVLKATASSGAHPVTADPAT